MLEFLEELQVKDLNEDVHEIDAERNDNDETNSVVIEESNSDEIGKI